MSCPVLEGLLSLLLMIVHFQKQLRGYINECKKMNESHIKLREQINTYLDEYFFLSLSIRAILHHDMVEEGEAL